MNSCSVNPGERGGTVILYSQSLLFSFSSDDGCGFDSMAVIVVCKWHSISFGDLPMEHGVYLPPLPLYRSRR